MTDPKTREEALKAALQAQDHRESFEGSIWLEGYFDVASAVDGASDPAPAPLPAGWVAVPRVLTPELLRAFAVAFNAPAPAGPNPTNSLARMDLLSQTIWDGVLSAAPLPLTSGWTSEEAAILADELAARIDYHDQQSTMADAMDMAECCPHHDSRAALLRRYRAFLPAPPTPKAEG